MERDCLGIITRSWMQIKGESERKNRQDFSRALEQIVTFVSTEDFFETGKMIASLIMFFC